MVVRFTDGTVVRLTQGVQRDVNFRKEGTPGSRRWYVYFTKKGSNKLERRPVRDIASIGAGLK